MKKSLVLALVASFLMAGTASAEVANQLDLKLDGSVTVQYRNDKVTPSTGVDAGKTVNHDGFKILGFLNANQKLGDNLSFYARFSYEHLSGNLANYGSAADYANTGYNGAIDAFGFKFNAGDWKWTLGSQAMTIGQGMIYDNGFIGKHALPYAINGSGKLGVVDTNVFWAKTNFQGSQQNDTFYGVQLGYDVSSKVNVGGFYTKWSAGDATLANAKIGKTGVNYYGLNTVIKMDDKVTFNGEYVKSNADTNNKGYIVGLGYALDKKSKVGLSFYRAEDLAAIRDYNFGNMTTAPNGNTKGYIFSYSNKLGSDTTLSVAYDSYTHINNTATAGAENDRNRTKVGLTFVF